MSEIVGEAPPPTTLLALMALVLAIVLALPIALASAVRLYTPLDHGVTVFSARDLPARVLVRAGAGPRVHRSPGVAASQWHPAGGTAGFAPAHVWPYLVMPTVVLALSILPFLVRYARSAIIENLGQEYVRVAHGKGLSPAHVLLRHVLRNSLIPVVTVLGLPTRPCSAARWWWKRSSRSPASADWPCKAPSAATTRS